MTDGITILDGQEGGFWDVAFDDGLAEAAGVATGMRTVMVHVDEAGATSLSAGWEPRSPEGRDETALFDGNRQGIDHALAVDARVQELHPALCTRIVGEIFASFSEPDTGISDGHAARLATAPSHDQWMEGLPDA